MVQLHHERAAVGAQRDGTVQAAVLEPQVIEQPEGLAREVTQLRVVALSFELGDDDDRQDDLVLGEAQEGPRIREQDGGIDHETPGRAPAPCPFPGNSKTGRRGIRCTGL